MLLNDLIDYINLCLFQSIDSLAIQKQRHFSLTLVIFIYLSTFNLTSNPISDSKNNTVLLMFTVAFHKMFIIEGLSALICQKFKYYFGQCPIF